VRECMHLVRRGHFRSRDKDGGDITRSVIAKNLMIHANCMHGSVFYKTGVMAIKVLHCGKGIFDLFALVL